MTAEERDLISGCLKRDKSAWDAFVVQYSRLVYHATEFTCRSFGVAADPPVIQDLYQEFFVSILRDNSKKLRQFRGDSGCSLASWLRIIATWLMDVGPV